jgi:hypothetical protein
MVVIIGCRANDLPLLCYSHINHVYSFIYGIASLRSVRAHARQLRTSRRHSSTSQRRRRVKRSTGEALECKQRCYPGPQYLGTRATVAGLLVAVARDM